MKRVKRIPINRLSEGMTAASDVYGHGILLLPEGGILNSDMIKRLPDYDIRYIAVYLDEEDDTTTPEMVSHIDFQKNCRNTIEEIRKSAIFKEFSASYDDTINELKYGLYDIVKSGNEVDIKKLVTGTGNLMKISSTPWKTLEMMRCLRDYDDSTFAHSVNVSMLAVICAEWNKFSEEEIQIVKLAGLLHDIGKLGINDKIIKKPDKLTSDEYTLVKKHPVIGYKLLEKRDIDIRIKLAALQHHEKCDGSGYPFNLREDKICKVAKVITIADVYDAMTAKRCYRDSLCPFDVIKYMNADAFTKYDLKIIQTFLYNIASAYLNRTALLSDSRMGEILYINNRDIASPILITDKGYVDLSTEQSIKILAVI